MDRFHAILVFSKVAELGGFAAAGRSLNMSPPAVTRSVSMLEEHLGVRLFVRTTRSVKMTDSGRRFLDDARRILSELEQAERAAVGSYVEPVGLLSITASVLFGRIFITPILAEFLEQYPRIEARTLYVDRIVNLIDEGMDVGVRIGHLSDSSLMAMRCGSVRQILVAAPKYLERAGDPKCLDDLDQHALINASALNETRNWKFQVQGKPYTKRIHARVIMNTNDAVIELALRGQGIAQILSYQAAPYLSDGRLITVLPEYEPEPIPINLVHNEGRMVSAKVRAFVDFAAEKLRTDAHLS